MTEPSDNPSGGIQSLDAALRVLDTVRAMGGAATLSDLARACAMPPSKVHRYVTSFVHAGLLAQPARSGPYRLGPRALQLGLSAMAQHEFVNDAADRMPELAVNTGLTVLLSIWGGSGATVVRWERAAVPMVTSMGLGTVLPLLNSATGHVFLTYAPPAPLRLTLDAEIEAARLNPALASSATPGAIDTLKRETRARGYGAVSGAFIPGLVAVAAPVLDWQGQAQAVLTLIGTNPAQVAHGSPALEHLLQTSAALSMTG